MADVGDLLFPFMDEVLGFVDEVAVAVADEGEFDFLPDDGSQFYCPDDYDVDYESETLDAIFLDETRISPLREEFGDGFVAGELVEDSGFHSGVSYDWESVGAEDGSVAILDFVLSGSLPTSPGGIDSALQWDLLFDGSVEDLDLADVYNDDSYLNDEGYDVLDGQFFDEGLPQRRPAAAAAAVESLPMVILSQNEENSTLCAICKEEIVPTEKVARLPCQHYYHGGCIRPWLRMRNTCPVCRYELPTDEDAYNQQ